MLEKSTNHFSLSDFEDMWPILTELLYVLCIRYIPIHQWNPKKQKVLPLFFFDLERKTDLTIPPTLPLPQVNWGRETDGTQNIPPNPQLLELCWWTCKECGMQIGHHKNSYKEQHEGHYMNNMDIVVLYLQVTTDWREGAQHIVASWLRLIPQK